MMKELKFNNDGSFEYENVANGFIFSLEGLIKNEYVHIETSSKVALMEIIKIMDDAEVVNDEE